MKALFCTLLVAAAAVNLSANFALDDRGQLLTSIATGAIALGSAAGLFMLRGRRTGRAGRA